MRLYPDHPALWDQTSQMRGELARSTACIDDGVLRSGRMLSEEPIVERPMMTGLPRVPVTYPTRFLRLVATHLELLSDTGRLGGGSTRGRVARPRRVQRVGAREVLVQLLAGQTNRRSKPMPLGPSAVMFGLCRAPHSIPLWART